MVGNIIDYLEWYGRFGFDVLPFNEVDNLILAQLSYAMLNGTVPSGAEEAVKPTGEENVALTEEGVAYMTEKDYVTVAEAARLLACKGEDDEGGKTALNGGLTLAAMARGKRFADAKLSDYVNKHDFEKQEQFAALNIRLSDGTVFVAYSGTDDTLLGWKEDLNMAYRMPVPAQTEAAYYLERTADRYDMPIRIGGHSKGGNLAVYAALMCDAGISDRILAVYNNDGPGFLASVLGSPSYLRMKDRIHTIVPETSIVGMLLEHCEEYEVVKSAGRGITQHDCMNWQVYRDGFVKLDERSRESLIIDNTISSWVMGLTNDERIEFVDAVYDLLTGVGINYLSDLGRCNINMINGLIFEMFDLEPDKAKMIIKVIKALVMEYKRNFIKGVRIASDDTDLR